MNRSEPIAHLAGRSTNRIQSDAHSDRWLNNQIGAESAAISGKKAVLHRSINVSMKHLLHCSVLTVLLSMGSTVNANPVDFRRLPVGFSQCLQFFPNGKPPVLAQKPKLRELCYDAFAILHSGETKTPVYVVQRLNSQTLTDANHRRSDRFFADARLPLAERAELDDYKRSGYSRGHMAPAGEMHTPSAMAQSFSLANIVPQSAQHNSDAWAKIERDTRHFVRRAKGDVFIFTGPVYSKDSASIGSNQVRVPDYLFKLVFDQEGNRAWAHWQANRDGERVSRPISYEELVSRTQVDFLPGWRPRLRNDG